MKFLYLFIYLKENLLPARMKEEFVCGKIHGK